jgi:hypothetical protein
MVQRIKAKRRLLPDELIPIGANADENDEASDTSPASENFALGSISTSMMGETARRANHVLMGAPHRYPRLIAPPEPLQPLACKVGPGGPVPLRGG